MAILEVQNIRKSFGSTLVLDDISFTMADCAPLPMASTAITAAMPTIMPMQVRRLRVLLRSMASIATLNIIPKFTACDYTIFQETILSARRTSSMASLV